MTEDIERSPEAIRFQLLSPVGDIVWVSVDPKSAVKRLFTDRVLVRQPGQRALLHYMSGNRGTTRAPTPDECF